MGARDAAGWEGCLQNLETLLEGGARAKFVMDEWRVRYEHYVATFQPKFGAQLDAPESFQYVADDKTD
jgi:hypothetical protein